MLHDIITILRAKVYGINPMIEDVTTDSRTIGKNCLFIALHGTRFDAHFFAKNAVLAGASAILVNRQLPLNIPQLIVEDTLLALKQLSYWVRKQVSARVIALTGSSGKTSVKEMTASILRQCGKVLATQGNLNNDIGVSLTLLRLTPQDDFAIIELGANHIGEISSNANLVLPEIALVNNISFSHLAGFGSLAGVAQAKGEIFTKLPGNGLVILNENSNDWLNWQQGSKCKTVWRFSLNKTDNVQFFATKIVSNLHSMYFTLHSPQGSCQVQLPMLGKHNITNALAASALAIAVGANLSAVSLGLSKVKPIPGRLCPIQLDVGKLLIDDSYNANVNSMIAAAQVLSEMPGYLVMVVGDMAELGEKEIKYHQQVGKFIAMVGINKVLSIGNLSYIISNTSRRGEHFNNKSALTNRLIQLLLKYNIITILVKGSRNTTMEQVIQELKEKSAC